jgi:hypothetical protein
MKQKNWLFEKINEIDKPLPTWQNGGGRRLKLINSVIKKGDIITNTNKIQKLIREYFVNLYSSKLENLEEMDKFLDTSNQPRHK